MNDNYGKPLFSQLKYCARCCMPETTEGIVFDELGVCQVCQSSEQKMHINWAEREKQLKDILEKYRSKDGSNYDCLVPISGGKDSCFQLHIIKKVYGLKPLAVTFSHNWFSETGKYNLWNILEKLNIDHVMFTPNRDIVNKLAKKSINKIGDPCWHCHTGVGSFPLQIAVKYKIPLLIWGESICESSGRASYNNPVRKYDRDYFVKVSAKLYPEEMIGDGINKQDLIPFQLPSWEEINSVGIVGIHLGDFMFWDDERQVEFLKKEYGWKEDYVEGTYKGYKSVECIMSGAHDYTKFLKRGFGRTTDHASQDVRTGLMTREEAFELIKKIDPARPDIMDYLLEVTGMTEKELETAIKSLRDGKSKELKL